MATKILGNMGYVTKTAFGVPNFLNVTGSYTRTSTDLTVVVSGLKSPDTSTSRGFYFGSDTVGGITRRMHYKFDYRFESSEGAAEGVIKWFNLEKATAIQLTMTSEWKTAEGTFVRSQVDGYYALCFYNTGSKTFPLGTYYFRNVLIEDMPWILTVNGKPLTITTT